MAVFLAVFGLWYSTSPGFAQHWSLVRQGYWQSASCSADGVRVIVAAPAVISTNSGTIWWTVPPPSVSGAQVVSMSADGMHQAGALNSQYGEGQIYLTTNAWAVTNGSTSSWAVGPSAGWTTLAFSGDGQTLLAGWYDVFPGTFMPGFLYVATNSGFSWPPSYLEDYFSAAASSGDGAKMVAVGGGESGTTGLISVSTNGGAEWIRGTSHKCWSSVASSADGSRVIVAATAPTAAIWVSTNYGLSWSTNCAPSDQAWNGVACSADASRIIAVSGLQNGLIYVSTNLGTTWTLTDAPAQNWTAVACSADGCLMFATTDMSGYDYGTGGIYRAQITPVPKLSITATGGSLVVSWIIPSMNFVLQQTSSLPSGTWANVSNPALPNYTTMQNRVTLAFSRRSAFFRLVLRNQ